MFLRKANGMKDRFGESSLSSKGFDSQLGTTRIGGFSFLAAVEKRSSISIIIKMEPTTKEGINCAISEFRFNFPCWGFDGFKY